MAATVIIAGGTGFLGRAVSARLIQNNYRVLILTRHPDRADLPPGCEPLGWDAQTTAGWGHAASGAHALVNLSGESIADGTWTDDRKKRIRSSRVNSATALAQAASEAGEPPGLIVQVSGVGFYGDRGEEVLTESAPRGRGFLADVSAETEDAARRARSAATRVALIRPGVVLGRDGGMLPTLARRFRRFGAARIGSDDQWVAWMHIHDFAAAVQHLLDDPAADAAYNFTTPEPCRAPRFYEEIARAMGKRAHLKAPSFILRVLMGELADELILASQRALPEKLVTSGFRFSFPRLEPALHDLLANRTKESNA